MTSTLPKTYKAICATEPGRLFEDVEVELKLPNKGEILVKVLACGVCRTDGMVQAGHMGPLPRIPGHEIVGDVVAVPETEHKWKVGDRVGSGFHGGQCGSCVQCGKEKFSVCEKEEINGITRDGGYAEYVLVRAEAVVSVPVAMDPATVAPLLCAGLSAFNSLRHMDAQKGDIVAVHGIGGIGHLAIQVASRTGFTTVALSSSEAKRDLAISLGADQFFVHDQVEELVKMGGAAVIMCAAPSPDEIQKLVDGLAPDGVLVLLALAEGFKINPSAIIGKRLSVRGWPGGTPRDNEEALRFFQREGIQCLVEKFDLLDADEALQRTLSGEARFRTVLVPSLKKQTG